jgi:16S rRNA (cytidine1402-2'-O)-methyltransferase
VSLKILNHLGLKKPLVSYYRHNTETSGPQILNRILAGENCALVTDAGTPAISDPGEELVAQCAEAGVQVCAIPGPCALVTALAVSGLPTGRFTFEGFLAMNKKNRAAHLKELQQEQRTMIFYEAPHKLRATLADLEAAFGGERRISLCRELSKLHEEIIRTTLAEACLRYQDQPPKGEFVLVVEGAPEVEPEEISLEVGVEQVLELRRQGLSMKDAARQVAAETGLGKNELYALATKR